MATKICFTGDFKVTCEYGKKGSYWASGVHQGIDLVGITNKKVFYNKIPFCISAIRSTVEK